MSADFRFVVHASHRDAHEFAAQRSRNRFSERSFSHSWRPEEAQDRPLHSRLEFLHREIIENALFHLFEVVVILVQNRLALGDVDFLEPGRFRPGQRDHPFQIGARDHVFGRSRSHFRQPLQFAIAFLAGLGGHSGFFELLAKLVDFGLAVVGFAQFLVNRLELLAQQIFALALADLFLNLLLNLVAQLQNFEFLGEFANQGFQAPAHVGGFQQFLAQQRRKRRQVRGDEIGQAHRVFDVQRRGLQIVGKLRRTRHNVAEQFASVALQRHQFGVVLPDQVRLNFHLGGQERPEADQFNDSNALQTFQKHNHVPVGHLHELVDFRGRPDQVQIRSGRLLHAGIVLRHNSEQLFVTVQGIQQRQRSLAPNRKGLNASGKQARSPEPEGSAALSE